LWSIQSIARPTSWRCFNSISHILLLGLPSDAFPSQPLTKTLYAFLLSSLTATCLAYPVPLDLIIRRTCGWGQIMTIPVMWSYLFPCHLVPLRPKYSPQHSILKNHQHTFLRQCERQSFAPIQYNLQNYNSVYFDF
jgi:hypothetical protein